MEHGRTICRQRHSANPEPQQKKFVTRGARPTFFGKIAILGVSHGNFDEESMSLRGTETVNFTLQDSRNR
jgi:hypothetical protein